MTGDFSQATDPFSLFRSWFDEAKASVQAGLAFAPLFNMRRYRTSAFSDHPDYLAQRERVIAGLLKAGLPE